MDAMWSGWTEAVVSLSHLLSTVNSSLNFVIYCYKDKKFRESLVKMCGCAGRCQQIKANNNVNNNNGKVVKVGGKYASAAGEGKATRFKGTGDSSAALLESHV